MVTKKNSLVAIAFSLCIVNATAQDTTVAKKELDLTKPTNLYTQVNAGLEYRTGKTQNLYGVRTNVQYAFNPDNLLLVEVPLLYNDRTAKFGISDMRMRYFNVVKRNISKSFIVIAPFVDVSLPTGSFKNGLGSSSWSLAGGVVFGFIASKKVSLFPGISYIHVTKPGTDLIPAASKFSSNGIGLQFNASIRFDKRTFMFINPTPAFLNTNGKWSSDWSADINFNRIITPNKLKVNFGVSPNFTANIYAFKTGCTFYL